MRELNEGGKIGKVLLIEDNEMDRDMLSRRLIRRGFQVVFAMDGQQGVDLARSERPDIILMDMSLPVIDGWEATRRVKADDSTRGVPVIGLTAHVMPGDREKAIEAGCDDGGFNRSTQHPSLLIWHLGTVCIWRDMHGHGSRGSRRQSSGSAERAANRWRTRRPGARGTRAVILNGGIASAPRRRASASSVASTG